MSSRTVQGEREAPGHVAGRRRSRCRRPAAKRGLADFCRLDFANAIAGFVACIRSQCLLPGRPSLKVPLHQGAIS